MAFRRCTEIRRPRTEGTAEQLGLGLGLGASLGFGNGALHLAAITGALQPRPKSLAHHGPWQRHRETKREAGCSFFPRGGTPEPLFTMAPAEHRRVHCGEILRSAQQDVLQLPRIPSPQNFLGFLVPKQAARLHCSFCGSFCLGQGPTSGCLRTPKCPRKHRDSSGSLQARSLGHRRA